MHARWSAVLLSLALFLSAHASAQDACHVALGDLTVNDQPPPDQYREVLANGIQPTIEPIVQCYRQRVAERPGLSGNLQLRLWVSARQVIRVTPETNTLQDPALEQCAIARIREFRLPPEAPESGARVRFVLRFTTTTTPGSPPTAPPARPAPPTAQPTAPAQPLADPAVAGMPSRAPVVVTVPRATVAVGTIRGAMAADVLGASIPLGAFDVCPAGTGTIDARLTVARAGTVRASIVGGTIRDRALRRCVLGALRALRVPPAAGTTRATVTITLSR